MMESQADAVVAPVVVKPTGPGIWFPIIAGVSALMCLIVIAALIVLSLIPIYIRSRDVPMTTRNPSTTTVRSAGRFTATWPISWINAAPDGVSRQVIGINNQFPAPAIVVTRGDIIDITFINNMNISISVHWHGIYQRGSLTSDGVPGITQCAIQPGQSYRYVFTTAYNYGTFWYHSHSTVQLGDGLQGTLIILDPNDPWRSYYSEEDTLSMLEWYHIPVLTLLRGFLLADVLDPVPETGIVNGLGQWNCTGTNPCLYYRTTIQTGVTKRLRFINTSVYSKITVTIDGHTMRVIEADGITQDGNTYVRSLRFNPAQRYSVLITGLANPAESYFIRVTIHPYPSLTGGYVSAIEPNGSVILQYTTNNNTNVALVVPQRSTFNNDAALIQQSINNGEVYSDERNSLPLLTIAEYRVPLGTPVVFYLNLTFGFNDKGEGLYYFNGVTFEDPTNVTALAAILTNDSTYLNKGFNLYVQQGQIVDFIMNNANDFPHPMHLHGHDFWVLAMGDKNSGFYNDSTAANFPLNLVNPIVRDVHTVNPGSFGYFRYLADNPGTWIMHCHNDWHLNIGMAVVFIEAQQAIYNQYINSTQAEVPRYCLSS